MKCPHCGKKISDKRLLKESARVLSASRKTFRAGPGRPKSTDRCPCGKMTLARAEARNHRCQPT